MNKNLENFVTHNSLTISCNIIKICKLVDKLLKQLKILQIFVFKLRMLHIPELLALVWRRCYRNESEFVASVF